MITAYSVYCWSDGGAIIRCTEYRTDLSHHWCSNLVENNWGLQSSATVLGDLSTRWSDGDFIYLPHPLAISWNFVPFLSL